MKFIVNEAAGLQDHLTLVVKIKAEWIFGGRSLGEVCVPVKDLLEGVKDEGKAMQSASYQVWRRSGKPKGVFRFWYELGERFSGNTEETMTECPRGTGVGSGSGDLTTNVAIGGDCPSQKLVDARSDRIFMLFRHGDERVVAVWYQGFNPRNYNVAFACFSKQRNGHAPFSASFANIDGMREVQSKDMPLLQWNSKNVCYSDFLLQCADNLGV
ncbi:hypothetical protein L1987_81007 [Smallanthus sonchifolius]|uniref:Uncharacterized protein n=1 Tax=Smallanthus sonchifolius TaxID=185202 RepID=A0ACB8YPW3_9ASTR|nr:hypothetical protein L1987_81007 [Smallanthus sonchifolius]